MRGYWDYTETFRCSGGNDQLAAMLVGDIDADNVTLNDPVTDIAVRDVVKNVDGWVFPDGTTGNGAASAQVMWGHVWLAG